MVGRSIADIYDLGALFSKAQRLWTNLPYYILYGECARETFCLKTLHKMLPFPQQSISDKMTDGVYTLL